MTIQMTFARNWRNMCIVQVAHKMAALSSDWSAPYASSNAEYNILRRKFFVRGDTEHALNDG